MKMWISLAPLHRPMMNLHHLRQWYHFHILMCLQLVHFHLPIGSGLTKDPLVWQSPTSIQRSSTLIREQANAFARAIQHS